jgi:hypothetical protein
MYRVCFLFVKDGAIQAATSVSPRDVGLLIGSGVSTINPGHNQLSRCLARFVDTKLCSASQCTCRVKVSLLKIESPSVHNFPVRSYLVRSSRSHLRAAALLVTLIPCPTQNQGRRDAVCRSTLLTWSSMMILSRSFVCVADTSMPVSGQSRPPDCGQVVAAEVNCMISRLSTRTDTVQKNIAEGWIRISKATPRNQF